MGDESTADHRSCPFDIDSARRGDWISSNTAMIAETTTSGFSIWMLWPESATS